MQGFTEDTPRASDSVHGKSKLSVAPVDPYNPIAVGDNDPRLLPSVIGNVSFFTGQAFAVWTGSGLIFDVVWPIYYLNGVQYPAGTDQITLDPADPTNPRFDAIIVDATGANKITGTPAADPLLPTADPLTELVITYISVLANATTPSGITEEMVYNENTEWTTSTNNGTVNFGATTNPFSGIVHIDSGAFNNTHYLSFADSVQNSIVSFGLLRFFIRLKSTFTSTTWLKLRLYDGATVVSNQVDILDGSYGFDRAATGGYQIITIPISAFSPLSGSLFDTLRITFNGANTNGFEIDYMSFQGGVSVPSSFPNFYGTFIDNAGNTASPATPGDTFTFKGMTKTGPKEFTVDAGGGHEIWDQDDTPLAQEEVLQFKRLNVTAETGKTVVTRPADTFIGLTPPSTPVEGDIWTNSETWKTYKWYDSYWVEDLNLSGVNGISRYLGASFDGMGATVLVNTRRYFRMLKSGTIKGWSIVAEGTSPTCTIDIWKIAVGTSLPTVANTIMGTKPALSTGNAIYSTTMTGWTLTFQANDIFCINIDACTGATKIDFQCDI